MNIISREAELKYPEGVPGMDTAPLRSGYVDGPSAALISPTEAS